MAILEDPEVSNTGLSKAEIAKRLQERHTNAKMSSLQSLRNSIGWYLCTYRGTAFRRIKRGRWTLQDEDVQTISRRLKSSTRRLRTNTPAENVVHANTLVGRSGSYSQPVLRDGDSFLPRDNHQAELAPSPTTVQLPTFITAFNNPPMSQSSLSTDGFFSVGSWVESRSLGALSSSRSVGPPAPMLPVNFENTFETHEAPKPPAHETSLVDWRVGEIRTEPAVYGRTDTDPRTPFLEDLLPGAKYPDPGSFLPEAVTQRVAPASTIPHFPQAEFPVNMVAWQRCWSCGQDLPFSSVFLPTEVLVRPSQEHTRLSLDTSGPSQEASYPQLASMQNGRPHFSNNVLSLPSVRE